MKPIAVVTGATGGIGSAITRRLSGGYSIIGICRTRSDEVAAGWGAIAGDGSELLAVDLTDHDATTSVIEEVLRRCGVPSVLVNCAGITADGFFLKMTYSDWERVLATNLGSLFSTTQPIYRAMCEAGRGSVVNISSVNGERGQAGQVNYCASKAGVHGFTMALAREGARYGVRVNTVSPGYTSTAMVNAMRDDVRGRIIDTIPLRRFAEADEIAALVEFVASDNAAYMTGANVSVNGGLHIA